LFLFDFLFFLVGFFLFFFFLSAYCFDAKYVESMQTNLFLLYSCLLS
jgi:hypothetical protein